jgi:hypothetical protein
VTRSGRAHEGQVIVIARSLSYWRCEVEPVVVQQLEGHEGKGHDISAPSILSGSDRILSGLCKTFWSPL